MNREFKLWFLKLTVNVPVRFLDRFLKFPKPHYPQTVMVMNLRAKLQKVYEIEVYQGVFGVPDGNFERLLTVAAKVAANISEKDRYYRAWIGLLVLLANEQLVLMDTDPATLKRLIKEQWGDDINFLSDALVEKYMADFREKALCSYLGNCAKTPKNICVSTKKHGGKKTK